VVLQIAEITEKGGGVYINQPTNWVIVVCSDDESWGTMVAAVNHLCRDVSMS
jgi:hypothetical protein